MGKSLFVLQGNGSLYNRGCEAILRSTVAMLREEFGPCQFVNAPGPIEHPPEYDDMDPDIKHVFRTPIKRWSRRWFIHQFQRRLLRRTSQAFEPYLPEALATLAIGGDNYSLDYGIPWSFFNANETTLRSGKPLVLWGASVGPFSKEPKFEKYAARALKKVTLICARESETVSYLASLGIEDNVRAVADPAFLLEPDRVTDDQRLLGVLEQPCLGVNLSPLLGRYTRQGSCWKDFAAKCVKALLDSIDMPVVLIPHVMRGQFNDDYAFMEQIREQLNGYADRIVLVDRHYNACHLKWIISKVRAFIGARTHATIAALSTHVPAISIGYSVKARGINKDIFGNCDWLVSLADLHEEQLTEKTRLLLNKAAQIRVYLSENMPSYKDKARSAARYLREVVEQK